MPMPYAKRVIAKQFGCLLRPFFEVRICPQCDLEFDATLRRSTEELRQDLGLRMVTGASSRPISSHFEFGKLMAQDQLFSVQPPHYN